MTPYTLLPTPDQFISFQIAHYAERLKEARCCRCGTEKNIKERAFLRKTLHGLKAKRMEILN